MRILIPTELPFAALALTREPDGSVGCDLGTVSIIERLSGLPDGWFMSQPEDALAALITQWYAAHLAAGGEHDPVADDLIAEARAEDERGDGISHHPGRA
jgi:hypothetical protein